MQKLKIQDQTRLIFHFEQPFVFLLIFVKEKIINTMEKSSALDKYSSIFLLLSFGVLLTTFILSRNDCAQVQEYENLYYKKHRISEQKTQTENTNAEEKIVKTCKTYDDLPENWKTIESWRVGFIEAPKCPDKELIIIVNTAHKNGENRAILRRYFSELEKKKINFGYFFLLGKSETVFENENDFIIGDFIDTYDNLILKTKTSYEFFEKFCKEAKYYLLIDDDVTFNPSKIMEKLEEQASQNLIFGKRWNHAKAHDHPWLKEKGITISQDQWEKNFWPDYIAGPCAFMTAESARNMAKTAANTKKALTIPIEDVAFNGILREKACLGLQNEENLCVHLEGDTARLEEKTKEMVKYL